MDTLSAENWSTIALAVAALVNSIAYVLRRRADASAALVRSLLDRVDKLEARIVELEASLRAAERRADALVEENESLRDAISTGRVIPAPIRIARRDDTGRHRSLTQQLLDEKGQP
ncbi:MAG: hypothetical protein IPK80_02775 [Nannocystis sp.]|nr:hypothetical protein [Nannocystis sp.]